jgi:YHS domain-containing protein
MERIFSFLMFAVLFYLMMRFGCGAHAVHGHHHNDKAEPKPLEDSRDPVCGMKVAAGQGYAETFKGREYHFCSRSCLDKFDAQPDRFAHA